MPGCAQIPGAVQRLKLVRSAAESAAAPPEDVLLLREIRDEFSKRNTNFIFAFCKLIVNF